MANGSSLNWGAAIGGVAVAVGLVVASSVFGGALVESRKAQRVVTVKGLAEREVQADIAAWRLEYRGEGADAREALAAAEAGQKAILAFARAGGISEADVGTEPTGLRIERMILNEADGQVERKRFVVTGAARIRTANVDALTRLTTRTQELIDAGVLLGANDYAEAPRPTFIFTGLNAIKPSLIAQATQAARASAEQFAEDSGATVGAIASANQGVIVILPRDGEQSEQLERDKLVRVVSTIEYYLTD